MLEGLDSINWGGLNHIYGHATDVPHLIRALASDDKSVQDQALEDLWDRLYQDGRLSQAAPYAVPFLIEVLATGVVQHKVRILTLLYYLSDGPTPWAREPTNLKTYGEKTEGEGLALFESENELSSDEITAILERELDYYKQSHTAVREGLTLYLKLLETDPDPHVREICGWLLVTFPERVGVIAPHLRFLIPLEKEIAVKATLIWCLGRLAGGQEEDIPLFAALARTPEHPLIYFYAAAAMTHIAKKETPPDIVALVITGMYWDDWGYPPFVRQCPLLSRDSIIIHGCRALSKLGPEQGVLTLIAALQRNTTSWTHRMYETREALLDPLLDLAFGGKKRPEGTKMRVWLENGAYVHGRKYPEMSQDKDIKVHQLTELQRRGVTAIVADDRLWQYYDNIYVLYGLPPTREGLRLLLSK